MLPCRTGPIAPERQCSSAPIAFLRSHVISSFLGLAYKAAGGRSISGRDTFPSLAWLRPRIHKVGVLPFFFSFFPYG